jgi:hypothetical protein
MEWHGRDHLDAQNSIRTEVTLRFMPNMTIMEGLVSFRSNDDRPGPFKE